MTSLMRRLVWLCERVHGRVLVSVFGYGSSSRSFLPVFIEPIMTAIFYILHLGVYVVMYVPHTHTQTHTNTQTHKHTNRAKVR